MMAKKNHMMITGASSGIGRSLAIEAANRGFQLSLCGRKREKLNDTLEKIHLDSINHQDCFCVSNLDSVASFVEVAIRNYGPVDTLINCAGLNNSRQPGDEVPLDTLAWQMQINCYAPIKFMQCVIPSMRAKKEGSIVNVLSTTCLYANPNIAAYTASKAALDHYSKVMRKELRSDNIRMMSIYPGGVDTDFRDTSRPAYLKANDVAVAILNMFALSYECNVHEMVLRPQVEENFA